MFAFEFLTQDQNHKGNRKQYGSKHGKDHTKAIVHDHHVRDCQGRDDPPITANRDCQPEPKARIFADICSGV